MIRSGMLLLIGLAFAFVTSGAGAAEMTWHVRSESPHSVHLQFYSNDRDHVWPTPDEVYVIDDEDTHEYALSCNKNEKICYGAWVKNDSSSYWGAGYDGEQACEDCCFRCGGGPMPTMVLNP